MSYLDRMVVDGHDREEWLAARVGKIGGSDAASFSKLESVPLYIKAKVGEQFTGNAYTAHGNDRERAILDRFHVEQNRALFASIDNPRFVCTPDGIVDARPLPILVQVKTSSKPLPARVPLSYLRQIAWEQYVMEAQQTLLVWEHHEGFAPVSMDPASVIIDRDDAMIDQLVTIASLVLEGMDAAEQFRKELES